MNIFKKTMIFSGAVILIVSCSKSIPAKSVQTSAETLYGIIYNSNSWDDLSGFSKGLATSSIVSGKIQMMSSVNDFSHTLELWVNSCLEYWKAAVKFKIMSGPSLSNIGFGIGIHSTNTFHPSGAIGWIDLTNTATAGFLNFSGSTDSTLFASSASALSFSPNDYVLLTMERAYDTITVTAENMTTHSTRIMLTYKYLPSYEFMQNTGRFALFDKGGQYLVDSISVTSSEEVNAEAMNIGDSKANYFPNAFDSCYTRLLRHYYKSFVNSAGPAERTEDVISRLPEIIKLNPKQVFLAIGSNDMRSGLPMSTYQSNIQIIYESLADHSIKVYFLLPFYETAIDLSAQVNWLQLNFPSNSIVDTWHPMQQPNTLYSDGVHPNQAGHYLIYTTILQALGQ